MIFNPPSDVSLDMICSHPSKMRPTPPDNQIDVVLAFCGPGPISAGAVSAQSASWISDPKFKKLVQDVTFRMTPNEPPASYD